MALGAIRAVRREKWLVRACALCALVGYRRKPARQLAGRIKM